MTTRARDGKRLNCRAGGIAHCRNSRRNSASGVGDGRWIGGKARRRSSAGIECAQLLLQVEGEVEGQQK